MHFADRYGFGFGALERSFYSSDQKIFYGGSEQGVITVSDYATYPDSVSTPIGLSVTDTVTDLRGCGGLLFVTTKDDPNPGTLHVFTEATRAEDGSLIAPSIIQSLAVGIGPDNIAVTKDCLTMATANEGEAYYDDELGFINPAGSVSILRGPFDNADAPPSNTLVSLNEWTEEILIQRKVHLPLSLNAMIYWSNVLGDDFNATNALENYSPDQVLEPEYVVFSADEKMILCNLQDNNAVVYIDVETNTATNIFS